LSARHPRAVIDAVRAAPARDEGSVFRRTGVHAVGGLRGAGNVAGTDLWLVVSSNGSGLFDALTGERVARDPSSPAGYPTETRGIGPARDAIVRVAGIDGGSLPCRTSDGWELAFDERAGLWLVPPGGAPIEVLRVRLDEARVLGVSETGRSFVVGDAASLYTFARSAH
jgi:hypothetical protein